jgi:phosphohistidine swiveling domain-containing protein
VNDERVWSRRIADELWSGVVTPLSFTMLAEPMAEHMVRRRLDNAGLAALAREPVFRLSRAHVYVNASLIAAVMAEIPTVFLSEGLLELLPSPLRAPLRAGSRPVLSTSLAGIVVRLGLHERGWMPWARADLFRTAAAGIAGDLAALAPPPGATDAMLIDAIDRVRERLGSFLEVVSWGMIHAYVFFHLTAELVARWIPDVDPATTMSELTMGLHGIRTFEVHDELVMCAALARADRRLRADVMSDPKAVVDECVAGGDGAFGEGIRALLGRHGHRFVGRDLSQPTWRERPVIVIEMVRKLLDSGIRESSVERGARRAEAVRRTLERIASSMGGSVKRLAFERVLVWCEQYYVLRENMRYHADLFLAALRFLALSAAERLVHGGALDSVADVFFLEVEELRSYLRGAGPTPTALAERARVRREEQSSWAALESPECVVADDATGAPSSGSSCALRAGGEPSLSGVGVCPGVATGVARVVGSLDELELLEPGEIVVASATDPSWTSMLAIAGALVVEMGGPLSHGAIVARELGIPAVVNVANATRALATGTVLIVDGGRGTVRPAGHGQRFRPE